MLIGQVPDPVCAVTDDNDLLGLGQTSALGFEPEMTTEGLDITEVGVERRLFGSYFHFVRTLPRNGGFARINGAEVLIFPAFALDMHGHAIHAHI